MSSVSLYHAKKDLSSNCWLILMKTSQSNGSYMGKFVFYVDFARKSGIFFAFFLFGSDQQNSENARSKNNGNPTNENQNGFIRRFVPKGTAIKGYSEQRIQEIQDYINTYPRRIFDGKNSLTLFENELRKINVSFF